MKILLIIAPLLLVSFNTLLSQNATDIIEKTIQAHGGKAYEKCTFSFDFRGKEYGVDINKGNYKYTKSWSDSTGSYLDILTNEGFIRNINGDVASLNLKDIRRFSNSLNSVVYFTLLPKGLKDPAVNLESAGISKIKGEEYHQIKVTFDQEGGGDDYEDTFMYWIHSENYTIDYLAYIFHVGKGGVRFREAIDPIEIDGIRFQNYINYRPESKETPLEQLPYLLEQGKLVKLSEIVNRFSTEY